MPQIYLVLIRDGRLALTVSAALEDRLLRDGYRAMALVPTVRGPEFADSDCRRHLADWRTGSASADHRPHVVALYEDGLLDSLASLGLPAYVGVRDGDEPWIARWTDEAGAIMLPIATARDLVDAVAGHTPWSRWAAGRQLRVKAGPAPRRCRQPGTGGPALISRKVATVAPVTGPLLLAGGPVAALAAGGASQAPAVASGAPASVVLAADNQAAPPAANPGTVLAQAPAPGTAPAGTGATVNNGLEPTASWLERNTAPDGTLIMPLNQLAIHYPANASIPNCENGCTQVFQAAPSTPNPIRNPTANPPLLYDADSAMNWYFALPSEKEKYANFLLPPDTTFSTQLDGLQRPIGPDGAIIMEPDYVFGFTKGILLMPANPDKIPMSALPQDDPGSTASAQLAAAVDRADGTGLTGLTGGADGTGPGQQPAPDASAAFASGPGADQLAAPGATVYAPTGPSDPSAALDPSAGLGAIAALTLAYPGASATGKAGDTGSANAFAAATTGSVTGTAPATPGGTAPSPPDSIAPGDTAPGTSAPGTPGGAPPQAPSADAIPQQQQAPVADTPQQQAPVAAAPQAPPVQIPSAPLPQAPDPLVAGGRGGPPDGTTAVAPTGEAGVPSGPTMAGGQSDGGTTVVASTGGSGSGAATG